jgi:hypothetical protein
MRRILVSLSVLCSPFCVADEATITNYTREGNLKSENALDCLSLDQVKPSYTPADLFPASKKCLDNAEYHKASELYLVARIYAGYDASRVADISAHQAGTVLVMNTYGGLSQDEQDKFAQATDQITKGDPAEMKNFCSGIRAIGKPDYHPSYMIQHGMGVFTGDHKDNNGIVADFDPDAAWSQFLDGPCGASQ